MVKLKFFLYKWKKVYYNKNRDFKDHTSIDSLFASVAQLDRALASEARCRRFESCQVHLR